MGNLAEQDLPGLIPQFLPEAHLVRFIRKSDVKPRRIIIAVPCGPTSLRSSTWSIFQRQRTIGYSRGLIVTALVGPEAGRRSPPSQTDTAPSLHHFVARVP